MQLSRCNRLNKAKLTVLAASVLVATSIGESFSTRLGAHADDDDDKWARSVKLLRQ